MSVAATTATKSTAAIPKLRYLTAWFCPYAHRCTLALEHHAGRVEYEWIEALGWKQQPDDHNVTGTGHEFYYHWKADELKRVNPSAMVPTLIPINSNNNSNNNNTADEESGAVYESLVTVEYVDAISGATGKDRLNPVDDPYQAARCRIWTEKVNRECCSPYYGVLVRQDASERQAHFAKLLIGLTAFSRELTLTTGPLFLADAQLSTVDVALFPWAFRYYVLQHYCGPAFTIPRTAELEPYHVWMDHVQQLPSVLPTLPDKERYLEHIRKYADGSARSKVANAVRRGVAAHELDDAVDDYEQKD